MACITKKQITDKLNDSLYQNSIFLILTTVAMAGSGFIFWLINAKLFSASDIGIATAIIPTATMIAVGSLFGLDNSIVRFLHDREKRSEFIRSTFFLVAALSTVGASLFIAFSFLFSNVISSFFLDQSNYLIFAGLSILTALNLLSDSIFLANRRTIFTLTVTTTHSFLRIVFPFFFIEYGAGGILLAAVAAQLIGFVLSFYILQTKFRYFESYTISFKSLNGIWRYASNNYIASLFLLLPYSIVPIIVINQIGTAESAYYYIVTMIINLLYVIPSAATKSLFAEGSQNEENILTEIKKSIYFISIFVIPAIIIMLLLAGFILSFFGSEYADNGAKLLRILALSAIPYAFFQVANTIFKIKKRSHYLIICTSLLSITEIVLVYYFIENGLEGIGYAVLLSNIIAAIVSTVLVFSIIKFNGR